MPPAVGNFLRPVGDVYRSCFHKNVRNNKGQTGRSVSERLRSEPWSGRAVARSLMDGTPLENHAQVVGEKEKMGSRLSDRKKLKFSY